MTDDQQQQYYLEEEYEKCNVTTVQDVYAALGVEPPLFYQDDDKGLSKTLAHNEDSYMQEWLEYRAEVENEKDINSET